MPDAASRKVVRYRQAACTVKWTAIHEVEGFSQILVLSQPNAQVKHLQDSMEIDWRKSLSFGPLVRLTFANSSMRDDRPYMQ